MRKIKDVLRLKFEARLSHEKIAAATGLSKGAVTKYRAARDAEGPELAAAGGAGRQPAWRRCCIGKRRHAVNMRSPTTR